MSSKKSGKAPKTPSQKKFASLAPPKNKITFADKIAGAKGKTPKMKAGGQPKSKSSYQNTDEMGQPVTRKWREEYERDMNDYLNSRAAENKKNAMAAAKSSMLGRKVGAAATKMKMGGSCGTPKRLGRGK